MSSVSVHVQNLVKIHFFVLKIFSGNEFLTSFKGHNSVMNGRLGERGGSVVECRTPEREVRGSRPTAAVLCP